MKKYENNFIYTYKIIIITIYNLTFQSIQSYSKSIKLFNKKPTFNELTTYFNIIGV